MFIILDLGLNFEYFLEISVNLSPCDEFIPSKYMNEKFKNPTKKPVVHAFNSGI